MQLETRHVHIEKLYLIIQNRWNYTKNKWYLHITHDEEIQLTFSCICIYSYYSNAHEETIFFPSTYIQTSASLENFLVWVDFGN